MHYLAVRWIHSVEGDPVWLVSELDQDNWEIRKVEVFRNGASLWVDATHEEGDTGLSFEPIPSVGEINADPRFKGMEISNETFERIWHLARQRKSILDADIEIP